MKPLNDRILVQLDKQEEVTAGGIILPDNAREVAFSGEVLFAGPDVKEVAVGDRVFIGKFAGVEMEYAKTKCIILREADTLAILEEGE